MARPTLDTCVKFKRLCQRLGLPRPYVKGLLTTMWDVANATGNPYLGGPEDVEAAAEWPGEPGAWFAAMRGDAGGHGAWIDETEPGSNRYRVHDYYDHAPKYVKNRWYMEQRRRRSGKRHLKLVAGGGAAPEPGAEVGEAGASGDEPAAPAALAASSAPEASAAAPNGRRRASAAPPEAPLFSSAPLPEEEQASADYMTFPVVGNGGREWAVPTAKVREWQEAYPNVDIDAELRIARQWLRDHPKNRKTVGGMVKCLSDWIKRDINSGKYVRRRDGADAVADAAARRGRLEEAQREARWRLAELAKGGEITQAAFDQLLEEVEKATRAGEVTEIVRRAEVSHG